MRELYIPLSDEHLKAIGRVVTAFAALELEISSSIWQLLGLGIGTQHVGHIITTQLSFRNLLDIFASLYRHRVGDPEQINKLRKLLSELEKANQERNAIVHSIWGVSNTPVDVIKDVVRIKVTARKDKGLSTYAEITTVKDINDIADSIGKAALKLQDFRAEFQERLMLSESDSDNGQ